MLRLPGVSDVAVVAKPNADWGEVPVAYVVAAAGVTPESLETICLENLARYKRPKSYVFVDQLPRNSTGKVLKSELRARSS
jgi:long-chain acyl-CoA synthetase